MLNHNDSPWKQLKLATICGVVPVPILLNHHFSDVPVKASYFHANKMVSQSLFKLQVCVCVCVSCYMDKLGVMHTGHFLRFFPGKFLQSSHPPAMLDDMTSLFHCARRSVANLASLAKVFALEIVTSKIIDI